MVDCTKQVGWNSSASAAQPGAVIVDNGDGTGTITNPDGTVINFCTECVVDTDTTYTFPATVGLDGVMTVTDSNGGSQTVTIEFPEDVDIASNSVVGGVVQFVDSNGDPLPDLDIDLNPYISSPHPTIVASGDATATFDAGTNEWTIGFVDTDTDTFATMNADGDVVLADGTVVSAPADADGVCNANGTATIDNVTVDAMHQTDIRVVGSGNTGSHAVRTTRENLCTGDDVVETVSSMPRQEMRSLTSTLVVDASTALVGNSVLIDTFSFPSNLDTRRVITLAPFHIRKYDFVGFGNMELELRNITTGETRPIGGQIAYSNLGTHTNGSGHYQEQSWSGQQFFNDVEGNNDYELWAILDDASAFITQGYFTVNQASVATITAMRHQVEIT